MARQKITTFLWFDRQAEEAARFYASIFPNSNVGTVTRYPDGTHMPAGLAMTVEFTLAGVPYIALNGGPMFQFTEAISLSIDCGDQAEMDYYWSKLTADGGQASQCGWLKDKYGLSWQVVPSELGALLADPDAAKAGRVAAALMPMSKIDIKKLRAAAGR